MHHCRVTLDHPTDWPGFRRAARTLVQSGVPPEQVDWFTPSDAAADLFASASSADGGDDANSNNIQNSGNRNEAPQAAAGASATSVATQEALQQPPQELQGAREPHSPRVPADFVRQCETLVLHRDPARFSIMYRLLWRMTHTPAVRHDPLDADRLLAHRMARAVARDIHKMHAFVRFRPVVDGNGQTVHMAWFEPDHFITEATADFFVRRFTQMHWAILTPDACIRWDGKSVHTTPGAQRSDAPLPDAGEALWLTYYRHIFNPARLKLNMMKKEMPTRYWHNLPEASLISELAHTAHERSARMVAAEATTPRRRITPMAPPEDHVQGAKLTPEPTAEAP